MKIITVGKLQLRNVVLLTSKATDNWYELGVALCIPFPKMEKFSEKYGGNPRAALNRVYHYWFADTDGLHLSTWQKLISVLYTIKEFRIVADVEEYIKVTVLSQIYMYTYAYVLKCN